MIKPLLCAFFIVISSPSFADEQTFSMKNGSSFVSIKDGKQIEVFGPTGKLLFSKNLNLRIEATVVSLAEDGKTLFLFDKKGQFMIVEDDGRAGSLGLKITGTPMSIATAGNTIIVGDSAGDVYHFTYQGDMKIVDYGQPIIAGNGVPVKEVMISTDGKKILVSYSPIKTSIGNRGVTYLPGDAAKQGVIGFKPDYTPPSGLKTTIGFGGEVQPVDNKSFVKDQLEYLQKFENTNLESVKVFYVDDKGSLAEILKIQGVLDRDIDRDISKIVVSTPESVLFMDINKILTDEEYGKKDFKIFDGRIDFVKTYDGKIVLGSADSPVLHFYDLESGQGLSTQSLESNVRGFLIHDNRFVAISENGDVISFSLAGEPRRVDKSIGYQKLTRDIKAENFLGRLLVSNEKGNRIQLSLVDCNIYFKIRP